MIKTNNLLRICLAFLILGLMVNPVSGVIEAYGGQVSSGIVNEGDKVTFTGVLANYNNSDIYLYTMNVSITEKLGIEANRDPAIYNYTKVYEANRRTLPRNATFTDTMTETIDLESGAYNVSIFFVYATIREINPATTLYTSYALSNATFLIEGQTATIEFFQNLGIAIALITAVVIGIMVYNSKFKK